MRLLIGMEIQNLLIRNGLIKEKEAMNAQKYLLDIGFDDAHLPSLFNDGDKSYYKITELMEDYHRVMSGSFHKAKSLTKEEVEQGRSNAYKYLDI